MRRSRSTTASPSALVHERAPQRLQRRPATLNKLRLVALVVTIVGMALCATLLVFERQIAPLKADLAELRSVRHGLLNPERWKAPLAAALAREIGQLSVDEKTRHRVRETVRQALARATEENGERLIERLREATPPAVWRYAGLEAALTRTLATLGQSAPLKASADRLTDEALLALERPANLAAIEALVRSRLDQALASYDDPAARARYDERVQRYGNGDRDAAERALVLRMGALESTRNGLLLALAVLVAALLLWGSRSAADPSGRRIEQTLLALMAFTLLATALSLPMIEVEARLAQLHLQLSGQWLEFRDQVLFFEAKSVLALARGLAARGDAGSIAIAGLILVFSAALPLAKLGAIAFTQRQSSRGPRPRLVRWLAEESGKWTMADVFVVAILMAFIGFNGLADHQLARIGLLVPGTETENATRLGTGLYLLVGYCLISILLGRAAKHHTDQR